jgi:hypothetical protein
MNQNIIYEQYTAGIYYFVPYGESQVVSIDYGDLIKRNLQSEIQAQDIQLNNLKATFYPVGNKSHQNVIYYKDGEVERWNAIAKGQSSNEYKEYIVTAPSGKLTIAWDRSDEEDKWQINFSVDIVFVRPTFGRGKKMLFPPFSSSNVGKSIDKLPMLHNKITFGNEDENEKTKENKIYLSQAPKKNTSFLESDESRIENEEDENDTDDEKINMDLSLRKEQSMIITPSTKSKYINKTVRKKNN